MKTSSRLDQIKPSATLALNTKAAELKAQGKNVVSLAVGEPDFDTPEFIKEAALKAMKDGATNYTAVDGTPELKKAIQLKFERDNALTYSPSQIIASSGAKMSIYLLCQALLNPGDEAIIPAPCWVSYPDIAKLAGATPVIIETTTEQNFKITPEQLKAAITHKTKLLVLNSPSNPTGKLYSLEELQALADVLLQHPNVIIMSDDIYEQLVWENAPAPNILRACPELYDRTIIINGVSKTYAMTGWRIGYTAGDATLIKAMKKIQSQSTSCPCSIAQAAAVAAITSDQSCVKPMMAEFQKRHELVYNALKSIDGVSVTPSDGTFYSFPNMQGVIDRLGLKDDMTLSELLLEKAGAAIVPGSAFSAPGCLRISFAVATDVLADVMKAIQRVLY